MIRFICEVLFVIIFLILSIPFIIVLWLLGFIWPHFRAKVSQVIVGNAFKIVKCISGMKLTVKGLENIPKDQAVLFVPNHRSIFDIVLGYSIIKNQIGFVSKKEMRKVPIFSSWMALMNCQFLNRKDVREGLKVILKCVDLIKDGVSIVIFPEGTRNKGDEPLQEFHDGSFKIAEKTGCMVVPVVFCNTDGVFEKQFPRIKRVKVIVEFLPAIDAGALSREEKKKISSTVHDMIEETYLKNCEACK